MCVLPAFQRFYIAISTTTDVQDMGNIVDICGEQDYTVILERNTGFIKSNNYPQHYSAGTNCSCMLEVWKQHAKRMNHCILIENFPSFHLDSFRHPIMLLRYTRVVNITKVYIERNNLQL